MERVNKVTRLKTQVIVISGRGKEGFRIGYDTTEVILLPARHAYTKLKMKEVHEEDHSSDLEILRRMRFKYWVIEGGHVAKGIRVNCF